MKESERWNKIITKKDYLFMLRQMWKKRVCFVLAVILAVIAVTPMEMEHSCSRSRATPLIILFL